jgi:type VI secretion system protein VasG
MVSVNLKALVGRLDDTLVKTLEGAIGMCVSRTHQYAEVEHWLAALIDAPATDVAAILKRFEIDSTRIANDVRKALDRLKTGHSRAPALSPGVVDLARDAWVLASVDYGLSKARSGHVICALLADETQRHLAFEISPEFQKIQIDVLRRDLRAITSDTRESDTPEAGTAAGSTPGAPGAPRPGGSTPNLDQYTIDLTARAKAGKIDPILGRDAEIRQVIDILTRRRQNNPILTGEAGVGKTAVAEGFALRIAAGDVPPPLRNVALRSLDLGLLQAGAGMKGEFENRLNGVLAEVKASVQPIIVFIDEAHQLIGAGGQAGQGDAANLLKPALARGELRTLAATTWAEYKKYFERDAALARRFQVVKVEEPTDAVAIEMMRGLVGTLEKHHKVDVLDEAVRDSVRLSRRYIPGRQLPDKSVSVLDTACARVALSQTSTPPAIEDARRRIEQTNVTIGLLTREQQAGADHAEEIARLGKTLTNTQSQLAALETQLATERGLAEKILAVKARLTGRDAKPAAPAAAGSAAAPAAPAAPLTPADREKLRAELESLRTEMTKVQGENPLVHVGVGPQAVAEIIASWTGIPVGRMVSDEITAVLNLKDRLEERVVGQPHALDAIAQAIRTSRANLTDPNRPIGVFLMVGTSGTGKTETAIALAEMLYGGEQNMTVINMSEFKEEHKVSLLMGSPPGYVGYGEGGVLTEAVRRKPYSVVLLDEMEKAHNGVQDVFYQVFDKGNMRDGEGRDIDFKNSVIIMTSNAGTDSIMKLCADPDTMPSAEGLAEALRPDLLKIFKPAFLGRVTLVPYFPLRDEVMEKIVKLKLNKVRRRVEETYKARFEVDDAVIKNVLARCHEVESGARNIDNILNRTLLPELSKVVLARMAEGRPIEVVRIGVADGGGFRYELTP